MLKDLTLLLKDQDKILPSREFKAKAETVLNDYQGRWLQTEYNAAIAGAQMASRWADIERDAQDKSMDDILLEYRTAGDQRVRDEHRKLDRIVRPASDPMWNSVYPPNGWNCRCNVIKKSRGQITPENKRDVAVNSIEVPAIFNTNLGKNGQVFPSKSPYYVNLPADVKLAHIDLQKANIKSWAKDKLLYETYNSELGDVMLSNNQLDSIMNQEDSNPFERNLLLYKLPEILPEAKANSEYTLTFDTYSATWIIDIGLSKDRNQPNTIANLRRK